VSRSERLLELLQILRRHRHPVSGQDLATELGISLRTLYRDIASLQAQGAMIEGEAGLGYVLRAGFTLPPLMFSEDEIEALVLGSRWVTTRSDPQLGQAARNALAKIAAVLPTGLKDSLEASTLLVGPSQEAAQPASLTPDVMLQIRQAIRKQSKLTLLYADADGKASQRIIWPFGLGFFDQVQIVLGWCELRQDFRHFRTDRIQSLTSTEERYPRSRQSLLKEWCKAQNITREF
jgi:predicted DNA-binding transcriptional regulator YafY